jgi:hypothetical protein
MGKNEGFSVTWIVSSKLIQSWATILQNPTTMTAAITMVSVMERFARAFIGVFLAAALPAAAFAGVTGGNGNRMMHDSRAGTGYGIEPPERSDPASLPIGWSVRVS